MQRRVIEFANDRQGQDPAVDTVIAFMGSGGTGYGGSPLNNARMNVNLKP